MARTEPRNAANRPSSAATAPARPRWERWGIPLLIFGVVFALFGRTLGHEFVAWDDQLNIYDNDDFKPVTAGAIAHYWNPLHPKLELYIPLTYTVWGALAAVASDPASGEIRPGAYHGMNVLLHAGAALLVFAALRRLGASPWPACGGALLFAVHPVQVDAVAWATGTKDVLSGVLCLAALVAYLKSIDGDGSRRRSYYAVATTSFVAAMLAKPSAVTLPLVVAVVAVLCMRRSVRATAFHMLPWLVLSVLFVIEGKHVQPASTVHDVPPLWFRPIVALDAVAFYVEKLLLPVTLVIDYGRSPAWLRHSPQRYWTWQCPVLLAAASCLLWLRSRRRAADSRAEVGAGGRAPGRAPAVALLVFVFALLPVLGLIPFEFQNNTTVADHYLYFAMVGPAIVTAFALRRWGHRRGVIAIAVAGLVLLAVRTEFQLRYWLDDDALFVHARETNPDAIAGRLAVVLGLHRLHGGRFAEARELFGDALRADPTNVDAAVNIGSALAAEGRTAEAIEQYRRVISEHPESADAHYNLGNLLLRGGHPSDAIGQYEAALRARPGLPAARANLAIAHAMIGDGLAEHGDFAGALPHFAAAVELDPTLIVARQKYEALRQMLRQQAPQTAPAGK